MHDNRWEGEKEEEKEKEETKREEKAKKKEVVKEAAPPTTEKVRGSTAHTRKVFPIKLCSY